MTGAIKPRLFAIELRTVAIVEAVDAMAAKMTADLEQGDILRDTASVHITVLGEVTTVEEAAAHEWDGYCIPYGGDEKTRLAELLGAAK